MSIPEIIAHRGAAFQAPENSLEAFELAIEEGAQRLELDVRVSGDGVPVVCHDATTERVGDRIVSVELASARELAQVRLPNGETIPTLEQVCAAVSGRATLDVELKKVAAHELPALFEALDAHGMLASTLFTSFDASILRALRRDPSYGRRVGRTGLLVGSKSLRLKQRVYEAWPLAALDDAQATELVIHHQLAHRLLRSKLQEVGRELLLWLAMEDEAKPVEARADTYRKIARLGVDGVIVARVAEAAAVIQAEAFSGEMLEEAEETGETGDT